MDASAIAAIATDLSQASAASDVQLAVFKKAIDLQRQGAMQLIQAAAQAGRASLSHLGNRIDTVA